MSKADIERWGRDLLDAHYFSEDAPIPPASLRPRQVTKVLCCIHLSMDPDAFNSAVTVPRVCWPYPFSGMSLNQVEFLCGVEQTRPKTEVPVPEIVSTFSDKQVREVADFALHSLTFPLTDEVTTMIPFLTQFMNAGNIEDMMRHDVGRFDLLDNGKLDNFSTKWGYIVDTYFEANPDQSVKSISKFVEPFKDDVPDLFKSISVFVDESDDEPDDGASGVDVDPSDSDSGSDESDPLAGGEGGGGGASGIGCFDDDDSDDGWYDKKPKTKIPSDRWITNLENDLKTQAIGAVIFRWTDEIKRCASPSTADDEERLSSILFSNPALYDAIGHHFLWRINITDARLLALFTRSARDSTDEYLPKLIIQRTRGIDATNSRVWREIVSVIISNRSLHDYRFDIHIPDFKAKVFAAFDAPHADTLDPLFGADDSTAIRALAAHPTTVREDMAHGEWSIHPLDALKHACMAPIETRSFPMSVFNAWYFEREEIKNRKVSVSIMAAMFSDDEAVREDVRGILDAHPFLVEDVRDAKAMRGAELLVDFVDEVFPVSDPAEGSPPVVHEQDDNPNFPIT